MIPEENIFCVEMKINRQESFCSFFYLPTLKLINEDRMQEMMGEKYSVHLAYIFSYFTHNYIL